MKKFIPVLILTALLLPVFVFGKVFGVPAMPPESPLVKMSGTDIIVQWDLEKADKNITWYKISVYKVDSSTQDEGLTDAALERVSWVYFTAKSISDDKAKAARISEERAGFIRGDIYRFRVAAILSEHNYIESTVGFGDESVLTPLITYNPAGTLGRPRSVTVEELTDSERVIVKWKAPINKTEAITHYMITVMEPENDAVLLRVLTTKSTDLSAPISREMLKERGLDPNGTYKITVQAGNKKADYGKESKSVIKSLAPPSGAPTPILESTQVLSPQILSLKNPLGSATFEELIAKLIDWILVVSLPIIVLLILYAGFQFMVSGVAPAQKKNAADIVKYALIGYAIMILAKVLVGVVTGFFA